MRKLIKQDIEYWVQGYATSTLQSQDSDRSLSTERESDITKGKKAQVNMPICIFILLSILLFHLLGQIFNAVSNTHIKLISESVH